ncbi:hypothetical protein NGH32_10555 [Staphylococcus xylosus]|uniref:hypothetical protein n=1 Tax=Staphylococcus xylosus TaxID=1288 RepID=UPI001C1DE693|nr:hypothetical protein [Staphylococcus xylosus]MBU6133504.1 hypothetical protein [Staphylococcus xylosus]MEB8151146.1 hypothetical protein [Staphylococcus xylosus]
MTKSKLYHLMISILLTIVAICVAILIMFYLGIVSKEIFQVASFFISFSLVISGVAYIYNFKVKRGIFILLVGLLVLVDKACTLYSFYA